MTSSRPRLAAIDGLRFLAAFAVVMFHYSALTEAQTEAFPGLSHLTIYGAFGVHLFFMISGFVILMTAWNADIPRFVSSRISRLFPAYWVCVLLTGAVVLLVRPDVLQSKLEDVGLKTVLVNLTMAQNAVGAPHVDGVYWTLWVELLFYLMIGVFIKIGLTRQRVLVFIFLWPLLAQVADTADSALLTRLLVPSYAPLFCLGMAAYLMHKGGPSLMLWLALAFNLFLVAQLSQTVYAPSVDRFDDPKASSTAVFVLIAAGLALLLLIGCTRLGRISWRPLSFLGLLTYPLYLVHENIGWWLIDESKGRFGWGEGVAVTATVACMLVLAALVHLVVEKPIGPALRRAIDRDLRRDLAPSREARRTRSEAGAAATQARWPEGRRDADEDVVPSAR